MQKKYFPTLPYLTPERSQKFFGIILTFLALAFFGFFAIKPTISTILKLQKELSDNQFVFDQLEIKIKNLTALRKQYFNLQNDLPIINSAITLQPDTQILFAQIQSIARMSDIVIKKLQNSEVEISKNDKSTSKNYYSYNFIIAGSGSSENILKFIKILTNMERVINLNTFSISIATDKVNESRFDIQGVAFFKNNL